MFSVQCPVSELGRIAEGIQKRGRGRDNGPLPTIATPPPLPASQRANVSSVARQSYKVTKLRRLQTAHVS